MKIIYVADTHFDSKGPASRADNYFDTCMLKLIEVLEYAKEHHISTILHGGDFFDSPKPGYSTLVPFMDALARYPDIHWYINAGNHDLYGWEPSTFSRTALKILGYLPNVHVLPDMTFTPIFPYKNPQILKAIAQSDAMYIPEKPGAFIYSVWSKFDREGNPNVFVLPTSQREGSPSPGYYVIVMAHTMLVEDSFISVHVPMSKIPLNLTGNLILGSHYHPGWRMRREKVALAGGRQHEIVFAHPAALLRTAKSDPKYCYAPAFIVVDIADEDMENPSDRLRGLELVPLKCAVPYPFREDAATIPERDILLQCAPKYDAFMEELMSTSIEASALDPRTLAARIAHDQGFPENVLGRVITNLDVVKKEH